MDNLMTLKTKLDMRNEKNYCFFDGYDICRRWLF